MRKRNEHFPINCRVFAILMNLTNSNLLHFLLVLHINFFPFLVVELVFQVG